MSWNVQRGGFREGASGEEIPVRETAIRRVIERQRKQGVGVIALQDTYLWHKRYGGEAGIARHLGYKRAFHTLLHDKLARTEKAADIGIVFTTNEEVVSSRPLELATRYTLEVVLGNGTRCIAEYGNDIDEDARKADAAALDAYIKQDPDRPTVRVGDFNGLRADMRGAALLHRAGDLAVRSLAHVLPARYEIGQTVREMNRREVIPHILAQGYTDADAEKRPTAPSSLPMFGVDYAFGIGGVEFSNFSVLSRQEVEVASDHRAIVFDVHVPGFAM